MARTFYLCLLPRAFLFFHIRTVTVPFTSIFFSLSHALSTRLDSTILQYQEVVPTIGRAWNFFVILHGPKLPYHIGDCTETMGVMNSEREKFVRVRSRGSILELQFDILPASV